MFHLDGLLAHDVGTVPGQQIVDLIDGAGGIVFDGQHAVIGAAFLQCQENFLPGIHAVTFDFLAEEPHGSLFRVGALLSLVEYAGIGQRSTNLRTILQITVIPGVVFLYELTLLLAAERHDGFEQSDQVVLHGRVVGKGRLGLQYLLFTLFVENLHVVAYFILTHAVGHAHTLLKQRSDLSVDDVNLIAQRF